MKANSNKTTRTILLSTGILLIVLGCVVFGMSLFEAFGGFGKKFQLIQLPGFHEIHVKDPGLYGGIYQHRDTGPIPVRELSKMDVRLMYKQTYQEIPVVMNTTGQTFDRFGVKGMPVFNFVAHEPGIYTLSGIYLDNIEGPTVPIMVFPQSAQNIKQTLVVGGIFFALFLFLGIFILVNLKKWAPR